MSIKRNALYNLGGALVPIAVILITLPLYIRQIGEERFAVLSIIWLLVGYFGVFDFGLSRATAHKIATLKNEKDIARSTVFWTATILNLALGIFGALCLYPVAHIYFSNYFKADPEIVKEALEVTALFCTLVPIATLTSTLVGSLQGREKFLAINAINSLNVLLLQAIPLLLTYAVGPSLVKIVFSIIVIKVFTLSLMAITVKKAIPVVTAPKISKEQAKQLFRFGGWVSVSSFLSPLMTAMDQLVIGAISGAKAVTAYNVPLNLAKRLSIVATSLNSASFPRMASSDFEQRKHIATVTTRTLLALTTPIIVTSIVLIEPFISVWMGGAISMQGRMVGPIVLVGVWLNGLAQVPYVFLQAEGRPRTIALAHLAEFIPYLLLLSALLMFFGVVGASIAWSARHALDLGILTVKSRTQFFQHPETFLHIFFMTTAVLLAIYLEPLGLIWTASTLTLIAASMYISWKFAPNEVMQILLARIQRWKVRQ